MPAYTNSISLEVLEDNPFGYEEVSVFNDSDAWTVSCGSDFLEGDRSVWRVDQGWAAAGTVFLQVSFNWCTYEDVLIWHLDPEAALRVEIEGEVYVPLDWSASGLADSGGTLRYTVVFAIPDDAQMMDLVFTPVGDLESLDGSEGYAFLDTPESTTRDLTF